MSVSNVLNKFFPRLEDIKNFQESEKSLQNLLSLLRFVDRDGLIQSGLEYFRNEFKCRPEKYPGDIVYYDLFSRMIKKGFTIEQSYHEIVSIIDKNIKIIDYCRTLRLYYQQFINWH